MFSLLPLVLAGAAVATPLKISNCDLSGVSVPSSSLAPSSDPVHFVGLGVGVQNYTCGADGKYAYVSSSL